MNKPLKASITNGLIGLILLGTFSFIYGGIYTEMIKEGLGVSLNNILFAFIGAYLVSGLLLAFIPVFIISLIIYCVKNKNTHNE